MVQKETRIILVKSGLNKIFHCISSVDIISVDMFEKSRWAYLYVQYRAPKNSMIGFYDDK